MEHIYIAMVDTPGIFAAVIRGFLKQRYIHVVIGLDAGLQEAYSFGRRNPQNAFPKSGSDAPPEAALYKKNRYIDFSDKRGTRARRSGKQAFFPG